MEETLIAPKRIMAAGDVFVEEIMISVVSGNKETKLEKFTLPGGALLLKDMMAALPNVSGDAGSALFQDNYPDNIEKYDNLRIISEGVESSFDKISGAHYHIRKSLGCLPAMSNDLPNSFRNFDYPFGEEPSYILIDDLNRGFRNVDSAWISLLEAAEKNKSSIIFFHMSGPLFRGKLWEKISDNNLLKRTILIIDADDLRQEGVNISRKLSWDRTIADFITILAYEHRCELDKCPHILIRFGLECLFYYNIKDENEKRNRVIHVFYLPNTCENEILENAPGKINGLNSIFLGFLAHEFIRHYTSESNLRSISSSIVQAVPVAAERVIKFQEIGYIKENNKIILPYNVANSEIVLHSLKKLELHDNQMEYYQSFRNNWSILESRIPLVLDIKDIAMEYVTTGKSKELENIPVVRFGKLITIDKNEIESFRSIRNLFREYFQNSIVNKPLSIAVFGPPGSGKSFAVKCVAESVVADSGKKLEVLEFNLSQFETPEDIIRSFHEIRDCSFKGVTPLVFFDEFDSSYKNTPLGWLKYFLAPMQDGIFKDGENAHPIGRAIFVFAGGTHRSLKDFSREGDANRLASSQKWRLFTDAKGPDFVSRLKGFVNILGPNPVNLEDGGDSAPYMDRFYIIRRAVLLRALLLQQKALVSFDKEINIDKDVLQALLLIPRYKHGARSMASIIEMSLLSITERFEKASLPSPLQLTLHVDADAFVNILERDLILKTAQIERFIHELFREIKPGKENLSNETKPSLAPWANLTEDIKQLNRMLARNIPLKLLLINCNYRWKSKKSNPELIKLSHDEIEFLAKLAHENWRREKLLTGWKYCATRNDEKKLHDNLLPWESLPENLKIDRQTIQEIPRILDMAGFEVYRMN